MCRRIAIVLSVLVLAKSTAPSIVAIGAFEYEDTNSQPPTGYSSPRVAFEAYRKALTKKDWRTLFQSLTPHYQDLCVEELIFAAAGTVGGPELNATLSKYGVNLAQLKAEYTKRLTNRPPDAAAFWRIVFAQVTDKAGFFEEGKAILDRRERSLPPAKMGHLEVLRVDGDTAMGRASATDFFLEFTKDKERKLRERTYVRQFYFRRVNSRWFLASGPQELEPAEQRPN